MNRTPTILVAGFGTMTGAIVEGWLRAGLDPASVTACGPSPKPVPPGMRFVTGVPEGEFDYLLLGMKPQKLAEAAPGLEPVAGPETVVLSVLAGIELSTLARLFPRAAGAVRVMPNLAAALGKSPVALLAQGLDERRREEVTELAAALGTAEWLADESQFELVTALAGSGPGFLYRFIDALAAGATRLGLDAGQAQRLAVQMVEGAAALAAQSSYSPAELARRVASPGGMTQKGLDVLDADEALVRLLTETLRAARDRGREMAGAAREEG
ncbi:pyrroline-5-carboxylate reductase [Tsuneonella deserti]|uniref:Pyrroline-5-carboxylate reductase n=1 Tax=Tsuneonella deserti TaxID=2035528 RepID=A0ABQ1SB88_9SPHN|nr:pyrroline-5-carboxylate reductase [Tsuneonella deserti]GGD98265.1 pyrroline-5-carboxylate reductase [Tsuneonella deserti]